MASLIVALFFVTIGFLAGWRYGYKEANENMERTVDHILSKRRS